MPTKKPDAKKTKATRPAKKPPAKAKKTAKKRAAPSAKKAAKKAPAKKAAFGRPGTAGKAEGDAPVRDWIAALPAPQRAIAERVDALVARRIPGVKRAIKWSMPLYGVEGRGWILAFAAFKNHVAVRFFAGTQLSPVPPEGASKEGRSVNYKTLSDVDEKQLDDWIAQASKLPGWGS